MKKWVAAVAIVVVVGGCALAAGYRAGKTPRERSPARGQLRHVMLWWFKKGATADEIKMVEDAFRALPSKSPLIERFEWGRNITSWPDPEPCSHCFLLTFKDIKDRDQVVAHPAYAEIRKMMTGKKGVLEFDYVVCEPPVEGRPANSR